jgi:hypothetical protein
MQYSDPRGLYWYANDSVCWRIENLEEVGARFNLYNKPSIKKPAVMAFLESGCYRRAIAAYLDNIRLPGEGAEVPRSIGPSENYIDPRSKPTPKQYSTTKYVCRSSP